MTKRVQFFWLLFTLALMFGLATLGAHAQGASQPGQQPMAQPQSPNQQPAPQDPAQTPPPDQAAPPAQQSPSSEATAPEGGQTFTGTIVKSGDKYVLQDATSGKNYDIDHQDIVQKYEGKHVRVHGSLDANGKLIHVQ
jgi:phage repressor protein C with HTH and peptisase S24 domain